MSGGSAAPAGDDAGRGGRAGVGSGAGTRAGGDGSPPVALVRPEDTRALGVALGRVLRAGDLVVLTGGLGAGKTTLASGIGDGLRVRGPVTSPTFVIARVHPSLVGGPPLIHVDAYRLSGFHELLDLDLESSLEEGVTVVEWGHGLAEGLAEDRLEILLDVDPASEERTARLLPTGGRWASVDGAAAVAAVTAGARAAAVTAGARAEGGRR